jgi:hypothetical protein
METARIDYNLLLMTSPAEIFWRPWLSRLYYSRALTKVSALAAHFRSMGWNPSTMHEYEKLATNDT